jgi:hypothetical protein
MPVRIGHLAPRAVGVYGRGRWGWAGADPKGGTVMVRKALFMLFVAAVIVPAAQAGNGNGNGKAKPLPADQAMALIGAPTVVDQSAATPVSKDAALAAMTAAGASTILADGYASPAMAVAASTGCAAVASHIGWGTWPYQRDLYENTYWCAVYADRITSYSTTVTTDQTLCSRQNTDHFTYSGGVGYSWVTVQANATWSCPIIGVFPYSIGGWIRTAYNDYGNAEIVDHS